MDVASLLAETADEYETDGDFEQQEAPSSSLSKQSPSDILISSAREVENVAKIEAQRILQKEADNIRIDQRDRSSAVVYSRDVSPERSLGKSEAPSKLLEVDENDHSPDARTAVDRNSEETKIDYDVGKDSYDAKDVDRDNKKTIEYSDVDEDDSDKNNVDDDEDDNDDAHDSDADPELDAELLVAAYRGDTRKVDKLLSSGAHYFARDRHRWTALMWAAAGGHDDTVESLIGFVKKHKLKSYLNAKDSITGWTALHVSNLDFFKIETYCYFTTLDKAAHWHRDRHSQLDISLVAHPFLRT